MQTLVCQTAEIISPEIAPQAQSLQKPRENEPPRESDFLSMLNASVQGEEVSQDAQAAAADEEKPALGEAEPVKEKAGAKKEEPKKISKKEDEPKSGHEKIDAFIQGALEVREPKKPAPKDGEKKVVKAAVKKTAGDSEPAKIDPKQLDFLRKLSEKKSAKEEEPVLAKDFAPDAGQKKLDSFAESASLLAGQNIVQEEADFSYAFEEFVQEKNFEEPKAGAARKAEKKPLFQVTDLRTKVETPAQKETVKDAKKNFIVSVKESGKNSVEMTLDLNAQAEKNILSLDGQSAASDGSTFQAMLKNQIAQNAGDFVKAANIVLRDNDQGQINLILHPEGLGNVKITMEMNGKSLVGHIAVNSREAMEAFGQNADALKQAFVQSGFEDAAFDVSFAGSQMNFAGQNAAGQNDEGRARQGQKIYGEFTQESLTSIQENSDNFIDDDVSVNVVA